MAARWWGQNRGDEMKDAIYRIGRGSDVDIQLRDESVSRVHAELIATRQGAFYLTDCGSTGGSYVARDSAWVPIRQAFISPTEVIMLGRYQTTARQLIAMVGRGSAARPTPVPKEDRRRGPVRRNPDTGEIIGDRCG